MGPAGAVGDSYRGHERDAGFLFADVLEEPSRFRGIDPEATLCDSDRTARIKSSEPLRMRIDSEVGSVPGNQRKVGHQRFRILELHRSPPVVHHVNAQPGGFEFFDIVACGHVRVLERLTEPLVYLFCVTAMDLLRQQSSSRNQNTGDFSRFNRLVARRCPRRMASVRPVPSHNGQRRYLARRERVAPQRRSAPTPPWPRCSCR